MNHNLFPTSHPENESTTSHPEGEQPTTDHPENNPTVPQPETPELEQPEAIKDLPTTSPNSTCAFYLRSIERAGRMGDVKNFLLDTADRDFHDFQDPLDLDAFSDAYSEFIDPALIYEDKTALKNYTGYNYRLINSVARDQWNYDLLGPQTPEALQTARKDIEAINQAIAATPPPEVDLLTHRGTNLDSFLGYDIHSLSDLKSLEGQFFLEEGFTSSSLSPDQSFTQKDLDDPLRRPCDIEITCRIPKESREVIGLLSDELSYNPEQYEVVISTGSLFYVSSAEVSPDAKTAQLEMTLIPRHLYDPAYASEAPNATE